MNSSFFRYIEHEKRFSAHTVTSYRNDLNQFSEFLSKEFKLEDLAKADSRVIRAWIVSLVESGLGPRTVNRKIASLRAYYKFLVKREEIEKDPTWKLKALKTPRKIPHFVKEPDILELLEKHEFNDDFVGFRDRLVLEMLYGTGIRLSELINLKTEDLDLSAGQIKVLGKRNKERIIPLSKKLTGIIGKYRKYKNIQLQETGEGYLIVTKDGKRSYPMMIYRIVRKYLEQFITLDKRSPHVLRHTFATHLLDKGAELNAVKDLLGHTSLAATQVYTHNSLEKLKSVFDQAHPKA